MLDVLNNVLNIISNKIYKIFIFYSYWIFAWFILYKLKYIKQSPYIAYLLLTTYGFIRIIQTIEYIGNGKSTSDTNINKNYDTYLLLILIIFYVDILPIFYIKHEITLYSTIIFIGTLLLYFVTQHHNGNDLNKTYKIYDLKNKKNIFIDTIFTIILFHYINR